MCSKTTIGWSSPTAAPNWSPPTAALVHVDRDADVRVDVDVQLRLVRGRLRHPHRRRRRPRSTWPRRSAASRLEPRGEYQITARDLDGDTTIAAFAGRAAARAAGDRSADRRRRRAARSIRAICEPRWSRVGSRADAFSDWSERRRRRHATRARHAAAASRAHGICAGVCRLRPVGHPADLRPGVVPVGRARLAPVRQWLLALHPLRLDLDRQRPVGAGRCITTDAGAVTPRAAGTGFRNARGARRGWAGPSTPTTSAGRRSAGIPGRSSTSSVGARVGPLRSVGRQLVDPAAFRASAAAVRSGATTPTCSGCPDRCSAASCRRSDRAARARRVGTASAAGPRVWPAGAGAAAATRMRRPPRRVARRRRRDPRRGRAPRGQFAGAGSRRDDASDGSPTRRVIRAWRRSGGAGRAVRAPDDDPAQPALSRPVPVIAQGAEPAAPSR